MLLKILSAESMRKPSVREQKPKVSELAVCNKTLASPTWASGLHLCIRGFDVSRSVHTASQGIPCDSQRFIVSQFLAELAIPKERTSGDRGLRACKSQSSQSSFATASNPESKRWRVGPLARAWAVPGHLTWYLPWRTCTYPKAQRAACAHPLARRGLSLISLWGWRQPP